MSKRYILTLGESRVRQVTFATNSVNMRPTLQKRGRKMPREKDGDSDMDSSLNGQPVRCVAVEQLKSIRNDILRWSQELLVSRARVEQYRTTEPQKARQFYRELEAVRQRLLSAL